jgi:hypothetical protein
MFLEQKGQISIELLIIVGLLFALFSFSLYVAQEKSSTIKYQEQYIEAKQLVQFLGNTINAMDMMPNGTTKYISLNKKFDYYFAIHSHGLHLIIPESTAYYDFPLTTNEVILNATNYEYISISKTNNQVVINDAE